MQKAAIVRIRIRSNTNKELRVVRSRIVVEMLGGVGYEKGDLIVDRYIEPPTAPIYFNEHYYIRIISRGESKAFRWAEDA